MAPRKRAPRNSNNQDNSWGLDQGARIRQSQRDRNYVSNMEAEARRMAANRQPIRQVLNPGGGSSSGGGRLITPSFTPASSGGIRTVLNPGGGSSSTRGRLREGTLPAAGFREILNAGGGSSSTGGGLRVGSLSGDQPWGGAGMANRLLALDDPWTNVADADLLYLDPQDMNAAIMERVVRSIPSNFFDEQLMTDDGSGPGPGGGGGGGGVGFDASARSTVDALLQLLGSGITRGVMPMAPSESDFAVDPSLFEVERDVELDRRIEEAAMRDLLTAEQAFDDMPEYTANAYEDMRFTEEAPVDDALLALLASQGGDTEAFASDVGEMQNERDAVADNWRGFAQANAANVRQDQDAYRRDMASGRRVAKDYAKAQANQLRSQANMMYSQRLQQANADRRAAQMMSSQQYRDAMQRYQDMVTGVQQRERDGVMALIQQIIAQSAAGGFQTPDLSPYLGAYQ